MTSINAIRFDFFSGAMVCDEQRHWNPERLKIFAADKIRPVVPLDIAGKYRTVAAYGNTGTSSIGDELRHTIGRNVASRFEEMTRVSGREPERFLTIEDIAALTFDTILALKHQHTDDHLLAKYGFNTRDFIRGKISAPPGQGDPIPLTNEHLLNQAHTEISFTPDKTGNHPVFGNAGILAGFDPQNGFQIYLFSMRQFFWEPVHIGFVAQGSGSDTANIVLSHFFNERCIGERTSAVDRVDGLIAILSGVTTAMLNNLGVGGYFNILLFDGRADHPELMLRQINDHRSRLGTELVMAHDASLVSYPLLRELIDGMFFENKGIDWAEERLWSSVASPLRLHRFLRGYPGCVNGKM